MHTVCAFTDEPMWLRLRLTPAQLDLTSTLQRGKFGDELLAPGGQYEWYASTFFLRSSSLGCCCCWALLAPGPPGVKSVVYCRDTAS